MNFPLLILCGGRATRMKELTKETPKSLLMIDDKPFLFHQLKKIEEYGRRKVILCTGVFSEQIESFIANEEFDLDILISKETQPLGTGGAVKYASRSLNSPFFVTYGDSFLDYQFKEMEGKYRLSGYPLLAIYRNEELHDVSNVVLKNGKVFYSKEKEKVPDAKYIDYGISLLESKYFDS